MHSQDPIRKNNQVPSHLEDLPQNPEDCERYAQVAFELRHYPDVKFPYLKEAALGSPNAAQIIFESSTLCSQFKVRDYCQIVLRYPKYLNMLLSTLEILANTFIQRGLNQQAKEVQKAMGVVGKEHPNNILFIQRQLNQEAKATHPFFLFTSQHKKLFHKFRETIEKRTNPDSLFDSSDDLLAYLHKQFGINPEELDDLCCPLTGELILGKVMLVDNGSDEKPYQSFYNRNSFNEEVDKQIKMNYQELKDPVTQKILKMSDLKDGTKDYRQRLIDKITQLRKNKTEVDDDQFSSSLKPLLFPEQHKVFYNRSRRSRQP